MATIACTVRTDIPALNKDLFEEFLIERGMKNFEVFTVEKDRKVYITFSSGAEHMKYELRALESIFNSKHQVDDNHADHFEEILYDAADAIVRTIDEDDYYK